MRFLTVSDIHGSALRAEMFSAKTAELRPDVVLILGDILYHGPRNKLPEGYSPPEVVSILSNLPAPVIAVRGNCDAEVDQMVLPWHLADSAWLFDHGRFMLAIHGDTLPEDENAIKVKPGSAIISGHTHIPTAEKRGLFHYWNPGSISLPKENFPPSFGLYEEGKFSVLTFDCQVLMNDLLY